MIKQRLLQTIVALVAIAGSATAQTLSVTSIEANVGEQTELVVSASGMNNVTALQFNLALPEEITLNESAITKGEMLSHALSQNPSGFCHPFAMNSCPSLMPQACSIGFSYSFIRSS